MLLLRYGCKQKPLNIPANLDVVKSDDLSRAFKQQRSLDALVS